MPRPPRIVYPGAWYHITARGIERRPIFREARDYAHFREALAEMVDRFALRLHAYVLMENHYHLLIELTQPNLSRAIQWLNVSYSVWFNRRHCRCGYLFQGRFKSILVDPQGWAVSLSAYIHLNPARVAALGLAKMDRQRAQAGAGALPLANVVAQRIVRIRNWRWSSYRAYVGTERCPAWLTRQSVFDLAGGAKSQSQANYRKYVEDQLRNGLPESPWNEVRDQVMLGSQRFVAGIKKHLAKSARAPARWARAPVSFENVIEVVEAVRRARWEEMKNKHADRGRDMALFLARRATGLTVAELAKRVGLARGENVSMAVKRYGKRLEQDHAERKLAAHAAQKLFVML